ncbi:hypothetical protein PR048_010978 [Dryococelus australis]|uniref:Uncharacterized protein n=1 Tax=Dryococelus australis TaxID=614101 RepID=A0ABQ9HKL4_9NEOP|nr:hypothetical protein PR048_010978 [Dryococelus australis]
MSVQVTWEDQTGVCGKSLKLMQHIHPFLNPAMSQEKFLYSQTLLNTLNFAINHFLDRELLDMYVYDFSIAFKNFPAAFRRLKNTKTKSKDRCVASVK